MPLREICSKYCQIISWIHIKELGKELYFYSYLNIST